MKPGLYLEEISEVDYHNDALGDGLTLSCSIGQALVLECPAYAWLRHPKLGGQPFKPNNDMDRGTLLHALLLGKGREVAIIECQDWKKPGNRELRDAHRAEGRVAVTRKLYDECIPAAKRIAEKLANRRDPVIFDGHSEVTIIWRERATNGAEVLCRARLDHVSGPNVYDLKITGDANPKTLSKGHLTSMGYDIQRAAYTRALESVDPRLVGRVNYRVVFCEWEPPYCVQPVQCAGSMRELGERKWQLAIDRWEQCVRTGNWPDYSDDDAIIEARPFDMAEFDAA